MGELLRQVESKDAASGMGFHITFCVLVKSTELKKKKNADFDSVECNIEC